MVKNILTGVGTGLVPTIIMLIFVHFDRGITLLEVADFFSIWIIIGIAIHTSNLSIHVVFRSVLWSTLIGLIVAIQSIEAFQWERFYIILGTMSTFGLIIGGVSYLIEKSQS